MNERNIGAVPASFIKPGTEAEYPGSGLHVHANRHEIKISPEGVEKPDFYASVEISLTGEMTAQLFIRDADNRKIIEVNGKQFLLFGIEYFTQSYRPPEEFAASWYKNISINYGQFERAIEGKEETPATLAEAASKTWTAYALREYFAPVFVYWYRPRGLVTVSFIRK